MSPAEIRRVIRKLPMGLWIREAFPIDNMAMPYNFIEGDRFMSIEIF